MGMDTTRSCTSLIGSRAFASEQGDILVEKDYVK